MTNTSTFRRGIDYDDVWITSEWFDYDMLVSWELYRTRTGMFWMAVYVLNDEVYDKIFEHKPTNNDLCEFVREVYLKQVL